MREWYSDQMERLLLRAEGEAQKHRHGYIDVPHLLLALCKWTESTESFAVRILLNYSLDPEALHSSICEVLEDGPEEKLIMRPRPHTPNCRKLLECADNRRRRLGDEYLGTEHLLFAVFDEEFSEIPSVACLRLKTALDQAFVVESIAELRKAEWRSKRDEAAEAKRAEIALNSFAAALCEVGEAFALLMQDGKLTPRQVNYLAMRIVNDQSPVQASFIEMVKGVEVSAPAETAR